MFMICFSAFEAWNIAKTVDACKKIAKQAKKAVDAVEAQEDRSEELKANATWLLDNATEVRISKCILLFFDCFDKIRAVFFSNACPKYLGIKTLPLKI